MVTIISSLNCIVNRFRCRLSRIVLLTTLSLVLPAQAAAESLSIRVQRDVYYVGEPLIVQVKLHLDNPIPSDVFEVPAKNAQWQRKVNRRLRAGLYGENQKLCSGAIGGGGFYAGENKNDFQATVMVLLGTEVPGNKQSDFMIWNQAGSFELVLFDDHNLESNRQTVNLLKPTGKLSEASLLWSSQGIDTLLMLLDNEHGEDAQPIFGNLCDNFGELIFGKYACAALTLRDSSNLRHKRLPELRLAPDDLAAKLFETINAFDRGHPLRAQAMLELSWIQEVMDNQGAEQLLYDLRDETQDGLVTKELNERLATIRRLRDRQFENRN